jgi:hypothetical protein
VPASVERVTVTEEGAAAAAVVETASAGTASGSAAALVDSSSDTAVPTSVPHSLQPVSDSSATPPAPAAAPAAAEMGSEVQGAAADTSRQQPVASETTVGLSNDSSDTTVLAPINSSRGGRRLSFMSFMGSFDAVRVRAAPQLVGASAIRIEFTHSIDVNESLQGFGPLGGGGVSSRRHSSSSILAGPGTLFGDTNGRYGSEVSTAPCQFGCSREWTNCTLDLNVVVSVGLHYQDCIVVFTFASTSLGLHSSLLTGCLKT